MPRLAIVISAAGSIEALEATLVSVLENRPADSEVVVALKRPYSDPYDLKDEVRFVAPPRRAAAIQAINQALSTVRAPFVHVLASGCTVSEGWCDQALSRFGDRRVAAVVPWVKDANHSDKLFAVGIGYRIRGQRYLVGKGASVQGFEVPASIIGPGLFAAFYRKAALDIVGGFSELLGPRQADADMSMVLRQAGLTIAVEPRAGISATPEADPSETPLREAQAQERLFWRNLVGEFGAKTVLSHLSLVGWDALRCLPMPQAAARLAGRLWGALELGSHARHRRHLALLAARAVPPQATNEHVRIDHSHAAGSLREPGHARVSARSSS